ncbi:hypothetical protein [Streptomyces sp. NPDC088789]|uniref:Rv1733c family protein n=1 Tax=Streptomyces sp. NPDC088789 TaxID=3365899 RepID=UPI003808ACF4
MSGVIPPAQPPPAPPAPVRPVPFWRWRRNPLRRRTDRLESWTALVLLLTVPLLGLAAMYAVGDTAHRHYRAEADRQYATRHLVTAALVHGAPRHPEPGSDEARETRYPVTVRLTAPDGGTRTGRTEVPPGLSEGDTVRVWVAADGTITEPPMPPEEVRSRALGWALLTFLTVALTGVVAFAATVLALRRRNLAAWDLKWAETAPRWTISP